MDKMEKSLKKVFPNDGKTVVASLLQSPLEKLIDAHLKAFDEAQKLGIDYKEYIHKNKGISDAGEEFSSTLRNVLEPN